MHCGESGGLLLRRRREALKLRVAVTEECVPSECRRCLAVQDGSERRLAPPRDVTVPHVLTTRAVLTVVDGEDLRPPVNVRSERVDLQISKPPRKGQREREKGTEEVQGVFVEYTTTGRTERPRRKRETTTRETRDYSTFPGTERERMRERERGGGGERRRERLGVPSQCHVLLSCKLLVTKEHDLPLKKALPDGVDGLLRNAPLPSSRQVDAVNDSANGNPNVFKRKACSCSAGCKAVRHKAEAGWVEAAQLSVETLGGKAEAVLSSFDLPGRGRLGLLCQFTGCCQASQP